MKAYRFYRITAYRTTIILTFILLGGEVWLVPASVVRHILVILAHSIVRCDPV